MTVTLQVSETLDGSAVSDSLAGGGTGVDLGAVVNGSYAPVISKAANTGKQDLYISHDAAVDPITDVKFFLESFAQTYGGADSAANDLARVFTLGNASGSSKNNGDGLSGGIWMEMDSDVSTTNQFDQATFPANVKIFGDNGGAAGDGSDLANAISLNATAQVYESGGEQQASAPVAGQIGKAADTVLGDAAHLAFRIYLTQAFTVGGVNQIDVTTAYSFTA